MKRVTNTILFVIIICCLSVICYKYYNYFVDEKLNDEIQSYAPTISDVYLSDDISQSSNSETKENNENLVKEDDNNKIISNNEEELKAINGNYEMWIEIPNTKINYPVVQTEDNEYYLKHSFKNESNMSGTIFVDYRNNIDEDKNIILYGHNMRNGSMFNNITKFKEDSFFNDNDTINIIRNNTLYQYEIFSVYVEDESKVTLDTEFIDEEAFEKYVSNQSSKSMYNKDITISKEDKIITLVTCSYEYDGARTVLVGKLKV